MARQWGPEGRQAAISFTFDNLGEASDVEFGRWPPHIPVGNHHSAIRDVPLILKALDGFKVAFFIESWNLAVYPTTIKAIQEAGHEIASHAVRHEIWCTLTPDQERDHLATIVKDFARHGIEIRGLRPPGGIATPSSAEILPEFGLTYISPLGVPTGLCDSGLAVLETRPGASDVAFYSEAFAGYRNYKPGNHVLSPDDFVEGMLAEIEQVIGEGGCLATVCHPFYQSPTVETTDPARIEALVEVLKRISTDPRIWVATPSEIAEWMRTHPTQVHVLPNLDPPAYWNPSFFREIRR